MVVGIHHVCWKQTSDAGSIGGYKFKPRLILCKIEGLLVIMRGTDTTVPHRPIPEIGSFLVLRHGMVDVGYNVVCARNCVLDVRDVMADVGSCCARIDCEIRLETDGQ